jgi:hypothetical protein
MWAQIRQVVGDTYFTPFVPPRLFMAGPQRNAEFRAKIKFVVVTATTSHLACRRLIVGRCRAVKYNHFRHTALAPSFAALMSTPPCEAPMLFRIR